MGKTYRRNGTRQDEELFIRAKRREDPDLRKLARALLAIAQAEVEAEREHETGQTKLIVEASNVKRSKPTTSQSTQVEDPSGGDT
jgi:HEAT repeat protein